MATSREVLGDQVGAHAAALRPGTRQPTDGSKLPNPPLPRSRLGPEPLERAAELRGSAPGTAPTSPAPVARSASGGRGAAPDHGTLGRPHPARTEGHQTAPQGRSARRGSTLRGGG